MDRVKAEIITVGTEIVLGQIVDTNTPYIAKALTERGIQVLFQTSVGDTKELLKSVLRIAAGRANLIITTGGLGLTANDITREAVSELFGVRLIHNKEACVRIQKFAEYHREDMATIMDEHNKQAQVPEGSLVITNDGGTAMGFAFRHHDAEVVCLPGVPREMESMLNKYLDIYFTRHTVEGCTLTRDIHTFGISERTVEDRVKDCIKKGEHLKVMTLVHDGIVTVSVLATAAKREDASRLLDKAEEDIRRELGHGVFGVGDETLECTVFTLLKRCDKTIAVAESCSGGLVSDKLTNISGISKFFLEGIVAYSNKAKVEVLGVPEELILRYGAVSPQVAQAMAEGVRKISSAHIGIGITGIAGPTGATKEKPVGLVYIGVVVDGDVEVKECRFKGPRIGIKTLSAHTALSMVRLKLSDRIKYNGDICE